MCQDHIYYDLQPSFVGRIQQCLEVCVCAKNRIDGPIVADIVSKIAHWRFKKRRDPDGIDTQAGNIIEFPGDTGEVTGTISVRIQKASRVDLIDNCATPPF
jgi:hypothetical protein